ncbi:MoaD/ThiS family protein [Arenicella xantha]|uniref:Molybdopterin synthase sulfur carrier subunit n=1 Tax=Arenicella xantha TaxID=644221 RepID=A0A395JM33_9GAMM|nr:MoaD/ThiS family protein [Arenicella xantha]RBP52704.1 molybdopterin synthase subunit MoaD [Arenicella xantha]
MIKVLFFAHLREMAGTNSVEVPLGDMALASDLLTGLKGYVPDALLNELQDQSAMVSINHRYAGWQGQLEEGAEVGILPPVSGG